MDSEIIFKYTDSKNKKVRSPLKIGDIVTLAGNSKKYIVIEIDMRGDLPWQRKYDGYGSSEPAEYENSSKSRLCFYAVPAATILKDDKEVEMFYPPVLTSGAFRKSDPQHAIVVDSDDPKKLGRVRIRYPWQSNHTEGTDKDDICKDAASPWIRMVTPMATNGGGMFFKPEAGDEVLVNFENGNIERPYVVGTLYSKHVPAPKGDRIIQSRNGHFIKFDDPTDASCLVSPVLPGIKFLKDWHLIPDFELALLDNFLGGITMSDGFGMRP